MLMSYERDATGAISKVYLVFHDESKSAADVRHGMKHIWKNKYLNLFSPAKHGSAELDEFLFNNIGCQHDNVNIFAALANNKSEKICTVVDKELIDAKNIAFASMAKDEKLAVSGQSILQRAIKTHQGRRTFNIITTATKDSF